MSVDRSWMDRRIAENKHDVTDDFKRGVEEFLHFAYSIPSNLDGQNIRCPCTSCKLLDFQPRDLVTVHLYRKGFIPNYKRWDAHGETKNDLRSSSQRDDAYTIGRDNHYRNLVIDAAGPDFDWNTGTYDEEESPNVEASKFYALLKDADEPLWPGCIDHTKLSAVSQLLNCKTECNMTDYCFDRMMSIIKTMLPKGEKLPENFYRSKQMVQKLGLGYQNIHACPNDCILYYKEHEEKEKCPKCGTSRFKANTSDNVKNKGIPAKVLRYFPITPRLQRLYMSKTIAEHMTWHKHNRSVDGVAIHPADSEAWKHFDRTYPSFALQPRNVRLGLCTDGFTPFGQSASTYSCWPVIVTPYNLPPSMCMKNPYMFLSLLIPGPKSPGKNIDVYLEPLVDELKMLWDVGVDTYDVFSKEIFQMRAALLWTVSDFPVLAMLSGWSTHGILSCPYCMEYSKAFYLENGRKPCFFDCHRRFLPFDHPYRNDEDAFKRNTVEKDLPPPLLSGEEVFARVNDALEINSGQASGKQRIDSRGRRHNWVKRSKFWDLPYWKTNLIRHNLDVMHIEKNVFENVFNTVMNVKNKTKDGLNARKDLKNYCNRPELELKEVDGKTYKKPHASYTLTPSQIKDVCRWMKELKLPDGYASNISRCVNDGNTISGLKSHDCHIFMERLLPIAFRDMLDPRIWDALTELSNFFRDLCSTVILEEHMEVLERNIVEVVCKLEKIFPPSFFDSMEHLPIHLAYEAKVGGPVQYRWMYPFERYMRHLKRKVHNKAHVKGSIAEAYNLEEISFFTFHYFGPDVETKLNEMPRNDDGIDVDPSGCLSILFNPGRVFGERRRRYLLDKEIKAAQTYILLNCNEILPFIEEYDAAVKLSQPRITDQDIEKLREREFAKWIKERVLNDDTINIRVRQLAAGPMNLGWSYNGCFVNGFKFHTHRYEQGKKTVNSGVCVKGSCYGMDEQNFFGQLVDVLELEYGGQQKVVLFECEWYDTYRGLREDRRHGIIDINHKKRLQSYEPFILAGQAHQVYFATSPSRKRERKDWWTVIKTKARRTGDENPCSQDSQAEAAPIVEEFYQEDEAYVPIMVEVDSELGRAGSHAIPGMEEEVQVSNMNEEYAADIEVEEMENDDEDEMQLDDES